MISVFGMLAWLWYGITGFLAFAWAVYCFVMWVKEEFFEPKIMDTPVRNCMDTWKEDRARESEQKAKDKEKWRIIELKGGVHAVRLVNIWKRERDFELERAKDPSLKWPYIFQKPMCDYTKSMALSCVEDMKKNGVWQEDVDPI